MTSDVAIVGGGIVGASLCWRLAQAGASVLIADAGEWGGEASWAGAGMLAPGGEVDAGGRGASLCLRGRDLYTAFAAELTETSGVPVDLRLLGAVDLAATHDELAALSDRAAAQARLGIESSALSASDLAEWVPGIDAAAWLGGRRYPCDGIVDPRGVMSALRVCCERERVSIRTGTKIESVRWGKTSAEMRSATGENMSAGAIVIAAGAWSSAIALDPPLSIPRAYPVRGHLIRYRRPPGQLTPVLRHGHTYLLQRSNGNLIAGTTQEEVGFDREIDPASAAGIHSRAASLLPALASAQPAEAWVGFRPAAAGGDPVMKNVPATPLWLAYGHFRNGILMAPAVAEELSASIISSLGKGRFSPL